MEEEEDERKFKKRKRLTRRRSKTGSDVNDCVTSSDEDADRRTERRPSKAENTIKLSIPIIKIQDSDDENEEKIHSEKELNEISSHSPVKNDCLSKGAISDGSVVKKTADLIDECDDENIQEPRELDIPCDITNGHGDNSDKDNERPENEATVGTGLEGELLVDDKNDDDDDELKTLEMTDEEKKQMYTTVKSGDIDLLEELMDKANADLNMIWFSESLLMTAIRIVEPSMCEFLIDNGVNVNFETSRLHLIEKTGEETLDWFSISCRQMAYDREQHSIVNLIDDQNGQLFKWIKLPPRTPRLWRPPEDRLSRTNSLASLDQVDDGAEADAEMSPASSSRSIPEIVREEILEEPKRKPTNENSKPPVQMKTEAKNRIIPTQQTPPATVQSCPEIDSINSPPNLKAHSLVFRAKSACHFSDTKATMFRKRLNKRTVIKDGDVTEKKVIPRVKTAPVGSYNNESRRWHPKREDYCPCSNDNYQPPKPTTIKSNPRLIRSAPPLRRVRFADESVREENTRKDTVKNEENHGFRFYSTTYYTGMGRKSLPRPAWETSQTRFLLQLPKIGRSVTRVNSTLYSGAFRHF